MHLILTSPSGLSMNFMELLNSFRNTCSMRLLSKTFGQPVSEISTRSSTIPFYGLTIGVETSTDERLCRVMIAKRVAMKVTRVVIVSTSTILFVLVTAWLVATLVDLLIWHVQTHGLADS